MLGMKRRRLIVEVVVRPRADGGRPSDKRRNEFLLAEVKYAELVGDEVQASKEKGLEDGGIRIPIGGSAGNSSEPK